MEVAGAPLVKKPWNARSESVPPATARMVSGTKRAPVDTVELAGRALLFLLATCAGVAIVANTSAASMDAAMSRAAARPRGWRLSVRFPMAGLSLGSTPLGALHQISRTERFVHILGLVAGSRARKEDGRTDLEISLISPDGGITRNANAIERMA